MPSPNKPRFNDTLITLAQRSDYLLRVRCCGVRHYPVDDVIEVVGNIRVVDLCERCTEYVDWRLAYPSARERAEIRLRRLVEVTVIKRPVWRDQ